MPITRTDKGLVTVFGGSGFVGRHVVRALTKRGWRVRAAVRRPDLAGHLQPAGMVGWVQPIQANLRYRWSIDRAVAGADAVVNLVSIAHETSRQKFGTINDFGARAIAEAARAEGLSSIVQISALGAAEDAPSELCRTKFAGEQAVQETLPASTIIRPSVIFGPEDDFFNRLATLARYSLVMPLFGGGETRFQPVYVGDVASVIADAVEGKAKSGTTYELGGPHVRTYRELMEILLEEIDRRRLLLPVPWGPARAGAMLAGLLPKPLVTLDQMRQLEADNVVSEEANAEGRTLEGLGYNPASLAAILPEYLYRFRPQGQFQQRRAS